MRSSFNFDCCQLESVRRHGELIAINRPRFLDLIKTMKHESGERIVTKTNSIYYSNIFTGDFLDLGYPQSVKQFYHESGDYIFLTSLRFKTAEMRKVRIRVGGENLEVLEAKKMDLWSSKFVDKLRYTFYLVSDFFVFIFEPIRNPLKISDLEGPGGLMHPYGLLTLTDLDFRILDQSNQAQLRNNETIQMVSSNKIISRGAFNNEIYLHEVDKRERKLVLLKRVNFEAGGRDLNLEFRQNPFVVSVITWLSLSSSAERYELNFDQNLRLISNRKLNP